jgi:hypothetical protein
MSLMSAKQHPRETKSGLNVSQQCHLSLSENGKWQICFPRVRRWSPRRCRITLQNVAYECQTTPSGNEKRTKRYPTVSPVTLRKRKAADMLPKSATLVTTQMSNNSSNVAYECQTTPSGNEKRTKHFPRVQNTLLRSKRGQKCYP